MPQLKWTRHEVKDLGSGLFALTVQIENEKRIPTRARIAVDRDRWNQLLSRDVLIGVRDQRFGERLQV